MTVNGYARSRNITDVQLCTAVKTTEIDQIQPFLNVGFRPIVLKNSFSIGDKKFLGDMRSDARFKLGDT